MIYRLKVYPSFGWPRCLDGQDCCSFSGQCLFCSLRRRQGFASAMGSAGPTVRLGRHPLTGESSIPAPRQSALADPIFKAPGNGLGQDSDGPSRCRKTERVGFDLKTYGYVLKRVWTVLALVSNEIPHNISHKQARFNDLDRDFLAQEPAELDGKGGFWYLTETRS